MSNYYEGSTGSTETIQTSGSTVSKEIVEKVHHPASQAKEFNPVILGKHPRVNEVEEINQIAQESEKSRRLFNRRAGKSATRNANNDAKRTFQPKSKRQLLT
ncbi:hypothetical protein H4Q26_003650 [Puccinia striiformis f. sp. tritici PST-130]|nr:hypothetical protein H4Q26_003650 [Puccinia striiformis f. sp. tritici PST-130]